MPIINILDYMRDKAYSNEDFRKILGTTYEFDLTQADNPNFSGTIIGYDFGKLFRIVTTIDITKILENTDYFSFLARKALARQIATKYRIEHTISRKQAKNHYIFLQKLISPIAKRRDVDDLVSAAREYFKVANSKQFIEFIKTIEASLEDRVKSLREKDHILGI